MFVEHYFHVFYNNVFFTPGLILTPISSVVGLSKTVLKHSLQYLLLQKWRIPLVSTTKQISILCTNDGLLE